MANPVLTREIRGRWRRPVTYIVLFSYAGVLALLMGAVYSYSVNGIDLAENNANNLLGRRLFGGFLAVQTGVWMMLSGALTAPAIAGERERGLLQGVLLSAVTPGAIVRGKLLSSLWFIVLLLIVPMPITSLCFTLGGLAPWEFITAFALLASTALSGACIGMATSACNRRGDTALLTTFITTLTLSWPPVLVAMTFERSFFGVGAGLCMIYQAILTAAALGVAADAVEGILPERESEYSHNAASLHNAAFGTPENTINGIVLGREEDLSYDRAALYPSGSPAPLLSSAPQSAAPLTKKPKKTWKDTPLSERINFHNPVMQHEVRARLRRRVSESSSGEQQNPDYIMVVLFFVLLIGLICLLTRSAFIFSFLWLLGTMVTAAVLGAFTFVREREQQTLQPLLLTMLSPGDVLFGKFGAVCFTSTLYSTPFLLPALPGIFANWMFLPLVLLSAIGTIICGAAIGMSLSWICRQAGVAVASAIVMSFVAFWISARMMDYWYLSGVALPLSLGALPGTPASSSGTSRLPLFLLNSVPLALLRVLAGGLLLLIVRLQLRPSAMEKDTTSIWNRDLTKEFS